MTPRFHCGLGASKENTPGEFNMVILSFVKPIHNGSLGHWRRRQLLTVSVFMEPISGAFLPGLHLSYLVTKEKKKKSLELDDNRGLEVLSFIK
jgi:hypothetical protein